MTDAGNITERWVAGDLAFFDAANNELLRLDGGDRAVKVPSGGSLQVGGNPVTGTGIGRGGGTIAVNADGSVSVTPASGKGTRIESGSLSIGRAAGYKLDVQEDTTAYAARFVGAGDLLRLEHSADLNGVTWDMIDMVLRSSGDAIFVVHAGGHTAAHPEATGGAAAFNCLIPYYNDPPWADNGRTGTTVNDRTGMSGLFVEVQPVAAGASGVVVYSWSNAPGMYVINQSPTGGYPSGNGRGVEIDSWGSGIGLYVNNQPTGSGAGEGVNISSLGAGHPLFVAAKGAGNVVFDLTSTGNVIINDNASTATTLLAIVARSTTPIAIGIKQTGDGGDRIQVRSDSLRFGTGTGTIDCNIFRQGTKAMRFGDASGGNSRVEVPGGVSTLVKAGVPADGDFPSTPVSGTLAVDTTGSALYVRVGSTWKSVVLA